MKREKGGGRRKGRRERWAEERRHEDAEELIRVERERNREPSTLLALGAMMVGIFLAVKKGMEWISEKVRESKTGES